MRRMPAGEVDAISDQRCHAKGTAALLRVESVFTPLARVSRSKRKTSRICAGAYTACCASVATAGCSASPRPPRQDGRLLCPSCAAACNPPSAASPPRNYILRDSPQIWCAVIRGPSPQSRGGLWGLSPPPNGVDFWCQYWCQLDIENRRKSVKTTASRWRPN
jgi:hypothetical protein